MLLFKLRCSFVSRNILDCIWIDATIDHNTSLALSSRLSFSSVRDGAASPCRPHLWYGTLKIIAPEKY